MYIADIYGCQSDRRLCQPIPTIPFIEPLQSPCRYSIPMPKPLYWVHPEPETNGGFQLKWLCRNTVGVASCRDGIVAGSHSHNRTGEGNCDCKTAPSRRGPALDALLLPQAKRSSRHAVPLLSPLLTYPCPIANVLLLLPLITPLIFIASFFPDKRGVTPCIREGEHHAGDDHIRHAGNTIAERGKAPRENTRTHGS